MELRFFGKVINSHVFKVLFFICLVSIEYLATTTIQIEMVENMWDKSNHFFAFFVLYILLSLGYLKMDMQVKIYILLTFAIQIEVVQYFIEGRYFSALDVVADAIGIVLGIIACKILERKIPKKINI